MDQFAWIPFYEAVASAISGFASDRHGLYEKILALADGQPLMGYLHFEHEEYWKKRNFEIDPFTVMGIFNRATTAEHRHELARLVARAFSVDIVAPTVFHGIAHLDPRKSIYEDNAALWNLWLAISAPKDVFTRAWDSAVSARGNALATLSMGLFWAAPRSFMPVDAISAPYIQRQYHLEPLPEKCTGAQYLAYMDSLDKVMPSQGYPAVALAAWSSVHGG